MSALFEVFYQPGKLFASLPERKFAWLAPLIAAALLGSISYFLMIHYLGAENLARQSMQMMASRMSPDQMQQAIAQASTPMRVNISYVTAAVAVSFGLLLISGALMAFAMMTKSPPHFGTMFAMVTLANFPYALVTALMTWLTLALSPDPTSLDFQHLLATNVGAFMNKNETSKGLYSLMTSLDLLTFVEIFLLSLGFAKITRSKIGGGLGAVLALWILWVFIKMGLALAFG
jgi:hypothetical protein